MFCMNCNQEKSDDKFKSSKSKKCNECYKNYQFNYREKNREKMKEYNKEYYSENKNEVLEAVKRYYSENKDSVSEYKTRYWESKKELLSQKNKEYYINNKRELDIKNKKYQLDNKYNINKRRNERLRERRGDINIKEKERRKNDTLYRLSQNIRSYIRNSFKLKGVKKNTKSEFILGCNFIDFKIYLESRFEPWMTWENYGLYNSNFNYGWDIDHIVPISSAKTEDDIIKLNHYTNLMPLCSFINRAIKRDNIIK